MSSPLSYEATSEILQSIRIPSAPAAFMDLHALMQQDEPDIDAVAATISRDPGLSALVLKTLNSPFFGLRTKVTSIRQATVLLGLLNIGNIVAGLALQRAMEESGGPTPDHYWESPMNIGMVAARLAQRLPGFSADEAYMLGLFHNVGIPLMMERFPDYLVVLRESDCVANAVTACEEEHYSTHHAVVGYFVSRSWGLPEHISELILRHHDVEEVFAESEGAMTHKGTLLAALKMAEYIDSVYWGRTDDPEWQRCGAAVLAYVGISPPDFADLVEDMVDMLSRNAA
ncbi:MAG: HDOD domain-containing protein [Gammaproteobacteria bacterium]|nr:HDOD domain-containing protein [Gammaproteobacteria bacterium]